MRLFETAESVRARRLPGQPRPVVGPRNRGRDLAAPTTPEQAPGEGVVHPRGFEPLTS